MQNRANCVIIILLHRKGNDMVLYVNATVRDDSRTDRIAREVLEKLGEPYEELVLDEEEIAPLTGKTLAERNERITRNDYSDESFRYARQLAQAETVVIAAPFWDLSFPANLKTYLERVMVNGLTFRYGETGEPVGLCGTRSVYYVSTSGGRFVRDYGFGYVRALFRDFLGVPEVRLVYAENLDVVGNDPDTIVEKTIDTLSV